MGGGRTLLQHCSAESYMVHVPDRLHGPRLALYLLPVSAQRNDGRGVDQSGRRDGNVGYPVHVRGVQRIHTAQLHLVRSYSVCSIFFTPSVVVITNPLI